MMTDDEMRELVRTCKWSGKLKRAVMTRLQISDAQWYQLYRGELGDQLERVARAG